MLPDIVYLCRPGNNEELRYSLRSLQNVPHNRVFIFGAPPTWVNRTTATVVTTPTVGTKSDITNYNLTAALDHPEVSDPFILFNDDFYITQPIKEVPVMHRGPITDLVDWYHRTGRNSTYIQGMTAANEQLQNMGYENPLSYEAHVPIPIHKTGMTTTLQLRNIDRYHFRTIYGNLNQLDGKHIIDVKVYRRTDRIPAGPYLSTSDHSFRFFADKLRRTFPERCEYEVA